MDLPESGQKGEIRKAASIEDVFYAVSEGRALRINELDKFYLDTDVVRCENSPRHRMKKFILNNAKVGIDGQLLFVGARGAGKSTELNHLQRDVENEIVVLNYSVQEELDPLNIHYIELFIVTMEKLFELAGDKQLNIAPDFLEQITKWTQSREIKEITDKYLSAEISGGVNVKIGIPHLKELFLGLKGAAKTSRSFKQTLSQTIEPRLNELIGYCNQLITAIRIEIVKKGYKDLLIIIEDLDKIPLQVAKDIFMDHANQLVQLKCNMIYTFPVGLYYNIGFNIIRNYFSDVIELPMIKVRKQDGSVYEDGITLMREIMEARIEKKLFENKNILREMILSSGGVLRDFFRMVKDAADIAEYRGKLEIGQNEYNYALKAMENDYRHSIADFSDDGRFISVADFYTALASLAKSNDKKPDNTETLMLLRQNLCVLSYNDENWSDVHPVVKIILKEKGLI